MRLSPQALSLRTNCIHISIDIAISQVLWLCEWVKQPFWLSSSSGLVSFSPPPPEKTVTGSCSLFVHSATKLPLFSPSPEKTSFPNWAKTVGNLPPTVCSYIKQTLYHHITWRQRPFLHTLTTAMHRMSFLQSFWMIKKRLYSPTAATGGNDPWLSLHEHF